MKRIHKSKMGFTLIEVILVIAIIVILAAVLFISISGYINNANKLSTVASMQGSSFSKQNSNINSNFMNLGY